MAAKKASKKAEAEMSEDRAVQAVREAAPDAAGESAEDGERPYETSEAVRKSMRANKRCDTKPELLVRKRLREAGLTGYRLQWKVPGHPDVAWPGKKTCLFINGCFWHRCPRCNLPMPKNNVEYWSVKFDRNVERDAENLRKLEEMGWKVHIIWECQLKKKVIDETFAELLPQLSRELGKPLAKPCKTDELDVT